MFKVLVFVLSFAITLIGLFFYRQIGLKKKFCIGTDINKKEQPQIPEGAGIVVLAGFWFGVIFFEFFVQKSFELIFLGFTTTFFSLAGFLDDLSNKFSKKTLSWLKRAIPIGIFSLVFGFVVYQDFFYAFLFGAIIASLASFQNTFAGLNGWEVGSGLIISFFLAFLLKDTLWFVPAIGLTASILALLFFNVYPAKLFPGDAGTLLIGSAIGGLALLSKQPYIILITGLFFLPHAIDFLLKLLTNRQDMTQQKNKPYVLLENGKLDIPDKKNLRLDFAKLLIKVFGPMHEKKIVQLIWLIVFFNCLLWIIMFKIV